jgi:hypothetical protein
MSNLHGREGKNIEIIHLDYDKKTEVGYNWYLLIIWLSCGIYRLFFLHINGINDNKTLKLMEDY